MIFLRHRRKKGPWESKSSNTSYLALSDGEVHAVITGGGSDSQLRGLTDESDPPTTMRDAAHGTGTGAVRDSGISMSVIKGNYWKADFSGIGSVSVYWLPEK